MNYNLIDRVDRFGQDKNSEVFQDPDKIRTIIEELKGNRKTLLLDLMTSSFGHTVRAFRFIEILRELGWTKRVVILVPGSTIQVLNKYIATKSLSIGNSLVIYSKVSQPNLNKVPDFVEALYDYVLVDWIDFCRDIFDLFRPSQILMSTTIFGNYYQDKNTKVYGFTEPFHIVPGSTDLLAIPPVVTRKYKKLQPLAEFLLDKIIVTPYTKAIAINHQEAGVKRKTSLNNFLSIHQEYDALFFPTVEIWDSVKEDFLKPPYTYIGELLPKFKKEGFSKKLNLIKDFVNSADDKVVLFFLGGSIFEEDAKRVKSFIRKVIRKISSDGYGVKFVLYGGSYTFEELELEKEYENKIFIQKKFMPLELLLKLVDVSIMFSGHGSLTQTILDKTPAVALSINVDQKMHAEKIEFFGLGKCLQKLYPWEAKKKKIYINKMFQEVNQVVKYITGFLEVSPDYENNDLYKEITDSQFMQKDNIRRFVKENKLFEIK